MKTTVGLWIDHKQTVIVFLTGATEEIKLIKSDLEDAHRQSGVAKPADDVRQREQTEHLNRYYDEVIASLRNSKTLLLMGPGEAKGQLKRRLERTLLSGREIEVETVDKLTEHQIVAKVRAHFQKNGVASKAT